MLKHFNKYNSILVNLSFSFLIVSSFSRTDPWHLPFEKGDCSVPSRSVPQSLDMFFVIDPKSYASSVL